MYPRDDVRPTEAEIEMARIARDEREADRACEGECAHASYTQDKVTGECMCDACGALLIDCIGRVLE